MPLSIENKNFLVSIQNKRKSFAESAKNLLSLEEISASQWLELGVKLSKEDFYTEAIYAFQELLKREPNSYYGLINTAISYSSLNNFEQAEQAFLYAAQKHPKKDTIYYRLGQLYFAQKQKEKGYKALQKAIELNPKETDNYPMLAFYAIKFGDYEFAESYAEQGIRWGNASNSYLNKGLIHLIKKERDQCIHCFYLSYLAFDKKADFWSDFKADYSVLPQYGISKEEYESLKPDIEARIERPLSTAQEYAAYWSRALNFSRCLLDTAARNSLQAMAYPESFLDWLHWGNHNYCLEIIAGDIPNFTQEIFSSSEIENHNKRPENQLLIQNGFLLFGSLSGVEYDLFDLNNGSSVVSIRKRDFFKKIPNIEEVYTILESSEELKKEFETKPSLKYEDEEQTKLRIQSPYVKQYLYQNLFNGPRYGSFFDYIAYQTAYVEKYLSSLL